MNVEELAISPTMIDTEAEIDPRLLEFIQQRINTFVKWDLLRFFHDLPDSAETAETVARATGRDKDTIVSALNELGSSGLLEAATPPNSEPFYMLTSDHAMRTLINSFMLACDNRQFRVKAIYHILRGLRAEASL